MRANIRHATNCNNHDHIECGSNVAATSLYGINVNLQDLLLANVAALVATAQKVEVHGHAAKRALLQASQEQPQPTHALRPSVIYGTAYGCFRSATQSSVHSYLHCGCSTTRDRCPRQMSCSGVQEDAGARPGDVATILVEEALEPGLRPRRH